MSTFELFTVAALLASNLFWLFYSHRLKKTQVEHQARPNSVELEEFLHDLTRAGTAVVKISPISVGDIMLRVKNNAK